MEKHYTTPTQIESSKQSWNRNEIACKIVDFEKVKQTKSQREFAKQHGVPRSTLQAWLSRKDSLENSVEFAAFFESPEGSAFLHRLIIAAHYEFEKKGNASIHNISNFLKLAGLEPFIACSYSTQNRVSNAMDGKIIQFGAIEDHNGMLSMPKKEITILEDETFHPDICLVAIEADSNYIMVEKYAENRTADTWNLAIKEAMKGLNVEVVQVSSDGAKSLIKHTCKGLGVHHAPDSFHVIQDVGKGTSAPLASKVKKAEAAHETAIEERKKIVAAKTQYESMSPRPVGRRPDYEKKISAASEKEAAAQKRLDQAIENQETVATAKADIGHVYHPYNLETAKKQDEAHVSGLLESCFDRIYAGMVDLSDKCKSKVDKAHRVVANMVATIAFFFQMVELHMDKQNFSLQERELMHQYLIPGFYPQKAAMKEKDKLKRDGILRESEKLLNILSDTSTHLSDYSPDQIEKLIASAKQ